MANGREVVVVSGVRTAIGDYGGSLKDIAPSDLAAQVVEGLEERLAVREAIDGEAAEKHILAGLAHRAEWRLRSPEESRPRLVVWAVGAGVTQTDKRRDARIDRALQFRHQRDVAPLPIGHLTARAIPFKLGQNSILDTGHVGAGTF